MKIDSTAFNFYGLFIILSIVIGVLFFDAFLFRWKLKKLHIIILNFLFLIFIILCGLGLTLIENYIFHQKIVIGFSSYGGLLGMIISVFLFCKLFKYNKKHLFKILFITVPLMYSISKIGCLMSGCCYGIEYTGIGNIIYTGSHGAPLNVRLLPVQFLESIFFLLVFIFLNILYHKKSKKIIPISLVLCGVAKFCLEFFRASWNPIISFTQMLSILFILLGLYFLKKEVQYEKENKGNKD